MAFDAGYGLSTVLEAFCVANASRFAVLGECWATFRGESGCQAPPVNAGRLPRRFRKFEIRNSKSRGAGG